MGETPWFLSVDLDVAPPRELNLPGQGLSRRAEERRKGFEFAAMNSTDGGSTTTADLKLPFKGRSLQQKAWFITVGVLIALAAMLALGIDRVFRQGANQLENQWVDESVRRVVSAQSAEVDSLEQSTRDYATWTDTYEFMADGSQRYVENNLLPATFANLQIDAFLLFDPDGHLQAGRRHRDGVVSMDGTGSLARVLSRQAKAAAAGQTVKGVIETPEGIALFALLPILRGDATGPSRGALAQVRFLDAARVKRWHDATNLDVVLRHPADALASRQVRVVSDHVLEVKVPISDVDGRTIAWWEMTLQRDIHLQGLQGRLVFYVVMSVLVLAAGLLMVWMLRLLVIARLEALNTAVQQVGATSDLSLRLPLDGADEITGVAAGINQMLGALERGEAARLAAEEERSRLNKQLQEAQKLEAIGTLTGGLAHDFNNLLTSIQGSTTLLRLEGACAMPAEEHLKRIEEATSQAARLVRQMMSFGRRTPTVFAPVHLPVIMRDTLQLLRSSVPKGIEFHFQNEAVNDLVNADAAQLQQVLVNLVTNASHAMAAGVGHLTVRICEVMLPDGTRPETNGMPEGSYLRLTISDTGRGIPAEVIPRVFEPFFTTKPVGSGTGLGLAVVHGIITQHHGSIGIQTEMGHGTAIIIHLPKVSSRHAPKTAEIGFGNGSKPVNEAGSLLLVDDDVLVRETLEAGLRRKRYRITSVAGGAQALKMIRENRGAFDAVITDQMMPGMTGTELGEIVANENPGLPLILVTGFASALNEPKVKAMGFSAMLMKPVTIDELDGAVRLVKRR